MARVAVVALLAAVLLLAPGSIGAQDEPLPGGRFFDDNETMHEPNIEAIAAIGVTEGCVPEGTAFCPEQNVSREQMASFLARALDLEPRSTSYEDVDSTGTHAGSIAAIRHAGITFGCNAQGTRFCPHDPVSREQMASFLVRALDLTPRSMGPFEDVSGTHLAAVNAIALEGITLGCDAQGTLFCPKNSVTRAQMASFIARGLELDPVVLPARLKMTGVQSVCSGSTPICSATSGSHGARVFYIQEGWFYSLPYEGDDQQRFRSSEFRLFIDGVEITNLVQVPVTDLSGTMVSLQGHVVAELEAGPHTIVGEWWWEGEPAFTSVVAFTVSG